MTTEWMMPQPYKTISIILVFLLIGLAFKNCRLNSSTQGTQVEARYPWLYCGFHECPPCSSDRIEVKAETRFPLQRNCIQWFRTPPGKGFDAINLNELGYVVRWVDQQGNTRTLTVVPHQPEPELGSSPCGTYGCEMGVSGTGTLRVQVSR